MKKDNKHEKAITTLNLLCASYTCSGKESSPTIKVDGFAQDPYLKMETVGCFHFATPYLRYAGTLLFQPGILGGTVIDIGCHRLHDIERKFVSGADLLITRVIQMAMKQMGMKGELKKISARSYRLDAELPIEAYRVCCMENDNAVFVAGSRHNGDIPEAVERLIQERLDKIKNYGPLMRNLLGDYRDIAASVSGVMADFKLPAPEHITGYMFVVGNCSIAIGGDWYIPVRIPGMRDSETCKPYTIEVHDAEYNCVVYTKGELGLIPAAAIRGLPDILFDELDILNYLNDLTTGKLTNIIKD